MTNSNFLNQNATKKNQTQGHNNEKNNKTLQTCQI